MIMMGSGPMPSGICPSCEEPLQPDTIEQVWPDELEFSAGNEPGNEQYYSRIRFWYECHVCNKKFYWIFQATDMYTGYPYCHKPRCGNRAVQNENGNGFCEEHQVK